MRSFLRTPGDSTDQNELSWTSPRRIHNARGVRHLPAGTRWGRAELSTGVTSPVVGRRDAVEDFLRDQCGPTTRGE
jgi:hypothetical protein